MDEPRAGPRPHGGQLLVRARRGQPAHRGVRAADPRLPRRKTRLARARKPGRAPAVDREGRGIGAVASLARRPEADAGVVRGSAQGTLRTSRMGADPNEPGNAFVAALSLDRKSVV